MPYYKLPHTDGVVMWFECGRPDLEPAQAPEAREPKPAASEEPKLLPKSKPKPKPWKAKGKGESET